MNLGTHFMKFKIIKINAIHKHYTILQVPFNPNPFSLRVLSEEQRDINEGIRLINGYELPPPIELIPSGFETYLKTIPVTQEILEDATATISTIPIHVGVLDECEEILKRQGYEYIPDRKLGDWQAMNVESIHE